LPIAFGGPDIVAGTGTGRPGGSGGGSTP